MFNPYQVYFDIGVFSEETRAQRAARSFNEYCAVFVEELAPLYISF